jgi:hypothetical protein
LQTGRGRANKTFHGAITVAAAGNEYPVSSSFGFAPPTATIVEVNNLETNPINQVDSGVNFHTPGGQ